MGRASESHQTGAVGVSEIQGKFERIGWGPVRNESHDIGTDLLVAARDGRRFERAMVGVQAKGGPSWFKSEERDSSGEVIGWWFYETDAAHFDDWVQHTLPHLVVIHDLDADVSYWAHVTPAAVERVGKGCRVFIPAAQTLDVDHRQELLDIATSTRGNVHLEGTAFDAAASSVAPGQRLRFALMAPRLIAPHRNRGHATAIGPEEAVALLVQGRLRDLVQFADHHDSVPDPAGEDKLRDWRWRLVRAFWHLLQTGDMSGLQAAAEEAVDPASAAASTALLLHALRRTENFADALDATDRLLTADELNPVDHAWMAAHRARLRLDLGDLDGAVKDAASVVRTLRGALDDPTASTINGTAAWTLHRAEESGHDLGVALTAGDTAIGWWRSQHVTSALNHASTRSFRAWAEDRTARTSMEDLEAMSLFAAEFNADICADHGAWRAHCALRSQQLIQRDAAPDNLEEALDGMRRSGDTQMLALAARRLRADGPVAPLSSAVWRLVDATWTHTTFHSNLEMLKLAGDLLPSQPATDCGLLCLRLVRGQEAAFVERLRPTFMVDLFALEAVSSLLSAGGADLHGAFVHFLLSEEWHQEGRDVLHHSLDEAVGRLDLSLVGGEEAEQLRSLAEQSQTRIGAALLKLFSDAGDADAGVTLRRRAEGGDRFALAAHRDVTNLTPEEAAAQIERASRNVQQQTTAAAKGVNSVGLWNELHDLTLFNLWFPDLAHWQPVVEALGEQSLMARAKRSAASLLIALANRIPPDVAAQIAGTGSVLRSQMRSPGEVTGELGGVAVILPAVTSGLADEALVGALAPLCFGTPLERSDLAEFLGRRDVPGLRAALAGLLTDGDRRVRSAAAFSIGCLLTDRSEDPLILSMSQSAAADEGTSIPLSFISGISSGNRSRSLAAEALLDQLSAHPASQVAQAAKRAIAASAPAREA